MPYASNIDLPEPVRAALPPDAQTVWRGAFNAAHADSGDDVQAAAIAWTAVQAAGWAKTDDGVWVQTQKTWLRKAEAMRYTLGIVYMPDIVDAHGDYATADVIEAACHDFNMRLQGGAQEAQAVIKTLLGCLEQARTEDVLLELDPEAVSKGMLGIQHAALDDDNGCIVESYLAPCELHVNGETVPEGSWLMGVIWSPEAWTKVEAGEINGLSLSGTAWKVPEPA